MFSLKTFTLLSLLSLSKCDQQFFECDFKANDCGITNAPNFETKFTYGRAHVGGHDQNMLALDISTAATQGARLITPYFETYSQIYACLTIEWYSYGSGQQTLSVTQQDKRDVKLWSSSSQSHDWQRNALNIDLRGGSPRFFFEGQFKPKTGGTIAIDNIRLDYHRC